LPICDFSLIANQWANRQLKIGNDFDLKDEGPPNLEFEIPNSELKKRGL